MTLLLILFLLQVNPIIQMDVGETLKLKPIAPTESYLPAGSARTCVDVQGVTIKAIWPGQCGVNILSQDVNGNWVTSPYPLMFYVPSYQTAFISAGTVVAPGGWQNLTVSGLAASDNIRPGSVDKNYRTGIVSGFSFGLPVTATILGIEVETEFSSTNTGATADLRLSLSGDGVTYSVPELQSHNGTNDVLRTYGGSKALWGRAWTATEVNSLRVKMEGRSTVGGCRVDFLRVKVHYF